MRMRGIYKAEPSTARRQAAFIYNAWFRPVALGIAIPDVFVMFALQAFDFWCADGPMACQSPLQWNPRYKTV